jgi:leader peptidase (prepilin peptidase)/N-methyltransferase
LVFIFGLVVGSFLNSVIYRLQDTQKIKSLFRERSHCTKCKKTLNFWDLIPLASFIFLYGKCRYCKKPISLQYPLVEISTALLFLLVYLQFGISWEALIWIILASILIVVFTYDLLHLEMPIYLICTGIVLGVILVLIQIYHPGSGFYWVKSLDYLYGAAALGGFLGLLVLISWEKWMGIGDIWMGAFVGLLLGLDKSLVALFVAFVSGALISLVLIGAKKKSLKDKIPFAPFLVVGLFVALIWGEKIINWYLKGSSLSGG